MARAAAIATPVNNYVWLLEHPCIVFVPWHLSQLRETLMWYEADPVGINCLRRAGVLRALESFAKMTRVRNRNMCTVPILEILTERVTI